MKIAGLVYAAIKLGGEQGLTINKTILQKLVYFSLPSVERSSYYKPYYYGPYSKTVQMIHNRLLEKNYVSYDDVSYSFSLHKDVSRDDIIVEVNLLTRLEESLRFLVGNGLKDTQSIAKLSKIHILGTYFSAEEHSAFAEFIHEKATLMGWNELLAMDSAEIARFRELAEQLERSLDGAATRQAH